MLATKKAGILLKLGRSIATKFQFLRGQSTFTKPPICEGRDTSVEAAGCPFDCEKEEHSCTPQLIKNLMNCQNEGAAMTCESNKNKKTSKSKENKEPFKSMWETIPGYRDVECIERLDNIHYKPSDKSTRVYQLTWEPCPMVVKRLRKVCCFDSDKKPPHCKTRRSRSGGSACAQDNDHLKQDYHLLKMCLGKKIEKVSKCQKIAMPDCPAVAKNTRCTSVRKPSDCMKICTPYPSFSECLKDEGKKPHPRECGCLTNASICEAYSFLERKKAFNIPPDLPAWPPRPK